MIKTCKFHGETEFSERKRGDKVCIKCNRERVYQWRRNAKAKLVETFGGKCSICGYNRCNRSLEFHHTEPQKKSFTISAFSSCMNFGRLLEECKKCVLVCSNCHAEIEEGLIKI